MHLGLCICELVPTLTSKNRLCLVVHYREERKTTNTGGLACRAMPGSERIVHGVKGNATLPPWPGQRDTEFARNLVLYPCDEAEVLSPDDAAEGPVRLVVPDGNWRQAAKMARRVPWMAALPKVCLPPGQDTRSRLRLESKRDGLATLEAIARAFGILEGHEVQDALEEVFRIMVDRTLYSRGQLAREDVYGGVPEGFLRHAPGP
jgi:DTW domain-containing protein YfiP